VLPSKLYDGENDWRQRCQLLRETILTSNRLLLGAGIVALSALSIPNLVPAHARESVGSDSAAPLVPAMGEKPKEQAADSSTFRAELFRRP